MTRTRTRQSPRLALLLAAVALVAVGAGLGWRKIDHSGPNASATFIDGTFSYTNSRDGAPIFTAANVRPGASTTGTVTITNTGEIGGSFRVTQTNVVDTPGPNGGDISGQLDLQVEDVTTATPVEIYSGKLSAMGTLQVGRIDAGESRTFRFSATLPDGGAPPTETTGDNLYQGSSMTARYEWTGTQDEAPPAGSDPPPPGPGPAPTPGGGTSDPSTPAPAPGSGSGSGSGSPSQRGDTAPPKVTLTMARGQRVLRRRAVVLLAACDERCTLNVSARVRIQGRKRALRLRTRRVALAAARGAKVRLGLSRNVRRAIRQAFARRRRAVVIVSVKATDEAGNRTVSNRRLRLPRAR